MWCAVDDYNHMCHRCAKGYLVLNIKMVNALLTTHQFFT